MRARRVLCAVVVTGAVLTLAPAAWAKSGPFPDLPGLHAAERLTKISSGPATVSSSGGAATSHAVTRGDRVPAPTSVLHAKTQASAPSGADFIRKLPGTADLPGIGANHAAARVPSADGPFLLAVLVVVLFTRFLFRLNTLGSRA